jgi:hypothetical protein
MRKRILIGVLILGCLLWAMTDLFLGSLGMDIHWVAGIEVLLPSLPLPDSHAPRFARQ